MTKRRFEMSKAVALSVTAVAGTILTFSNGQTVDRATLKAPPRGDKYQGIVDQLVARARADMNLANGAEFALTRGQLVTLIVAITGETDPNKHMRQLRWMTNMRNAYRPFGPRTPYILPLTTAERAALTPAPVRVPEPPARVSLAAVAA